MDNKNGKIRWLIFILVLFTYLLMSSQRTAPGLITDQLMSDFNVTAATIGVVASVQFLVYTGLQIPMGISSDRYGANMFLIMGAILTGLGTMIYSISTHVFILFSSRILTGIGDATIWVSLVLILNQWFNKKEFTQLIGVAGMTGSLGFLLATAPFSAMMIMIGWRVTFFATGVLLCLSGILLYLLLIKKAKQPLFIKNDLQHKNTSFLLRKLLLSRQAWGLFFCHFGVVGAYIGFIGSWAIPYIMGNYGMTRFGASQVIMMSLIGALVGAPFIGWVSSRLQTIKWPYIFFHVLMLLCWSTFLLFKEHPPFYLFLILFVVIGFSFGSNSLTFAIIRQSFKLTESGVVSGFANTGGFLSAVLLPSIFGYILDHFQSATGRIVEGYYFGFIVPIIFSIIGLIGVSLIKEKHEV